MADFNVVQWFLARKVEDEFFMVEGECIHPLKKPVKSLRSIVFVSRHRKTLGTLSNEDGNANDDSSEKSLF